MKDKIEVLNRKGIQECYDMKPRIFNTWLIDELGIPGTRAQKLGQAVDQLHSAIALMDPERFVALFAEQDAERVSSILEALSLLQGEQIAPDLPDLTDTRSALEDQMKRLDRGVGQGATP